VRLEPGKYVVAVSGGVDSVVLLHMLAGEPGNSGMAGWRDGDASSSVHTTIPPSHYSARALTVAHYDHGMRPDSDSDRQFVQALAESYQLPFVYETGKLGASASEAAAREKRYAFLRSVQKQQAAEAIVTAHHQDDVMETAIINMLRGTGRKGLTSLRDQKEVRRPLLAWSKRDILDYARQHDLQWREDSTNQDQAYLRNYVRLSILPKFNAANRQKLLDLIVDTGETNQELDALLNEQLGDELDRGWFVKLPHDVAREVLASWLRQHEIRDFDRKTLERLVVGAKVARPDAQLDIAQGWTLSIARNTLALSSRLDLEQP